MHLDVDQRPGVGATLGSLEPSHLWVLGLAVDDDGSLIGAGNRPYSYWADCECPGDCLRDHENE
jgi:hypothetical protein